MNEVLKALAHPTRRKVLAMLKRKPMTSGDIAAAFDVAWPTMTAHLNTLRDAGLVSAERDGTSIRYRLNASVMEETAAALLDLAGVRSKQERSKS
jgi:DNA-binding transcriptional ArsR family regulator